MSSCGLCFGCAGPLLLCVGPSQAAVPEALSSLAARGPPLLRSTGSRCVGLSSSGARGFVALRHVGIWFPDRIEPMPPAPGDGLPNHWTAGKPLARTLDALLFLPTKYAVELTVHLSEGRPRPEEMGSKSALGEDFAAQTAWLRVQHPHVPRSGVHSLTDITGHRQGHGA